MKKNLNKHYSAKLSPLQIGLNLVVGFLRLMDNSKENKARHDHFSTGIQEQIDIENEVISAKVNKICTPYWDGRESK
ncbi:hypothetical protein E9531_14475 [Lampropedia puyangensis]|uniref:Uncharacterized protein n=1 Tax=Lampropedia puyangensis TaxID=1330072 RepID=A0A4S8EX21_9BURK|nr:hypothetical protein [Lampropedia puyangensis]THT98414.1 hypothetical protein E9531_14475 [Lampropedia puyangensis]